MSEQKPKSLVSKLAEVMATVSRIPKRGRNEFHKYDYATEADIAATVRTELALRHIMLVPAIVGEQRHPVGEKGSVLTVLDMEMEFLDGESGESLKRTWKGYGTDKEDKGGYKAMTGGEKYFLLKTFLMPTGDDPEADNPRERKDSAAQSAVAPEGYGPFVVKATTVADKGNEAFQKFWECEAPAFRKFLTKHDVDTYNALRARVADADKQKVAVVQ